jgi:hypothetical protein
VNRRPWWSFVILAVGFLAWGAASAVSYRQMLATPQTVAWDLLFGVAVMGSVALIFAISMGLAMWWARRKP